MPSTMVRGPRSSAGSRLTKLRLSAPLPGSAPTPIGSSYPDIVMGGMASLRFSRMWLTRLRNRRALSNARFMIAVQNGIVPAHVRDLVSPRVGIFVGGDTEWKLATMAGWARFARARGAICHVGRVNSARRIHLCAAAGADSFDGSGVSRFAEALPPLDLARRQADVEGWLSRDEIASLAPPFSN